MSKWQSMGTAPRDGSDILVVCSYTKDYHRVYYEDGFWMSYSGGYVSQPMFWMSVPSIPSDL